MGEEVGTDRCLSGGHSERNGDGKIERSWMGDTIGEVVVYQRGSYNGISYWVRVRKLEGYPLRESLDSEGGSEIICSDES